MLPTCLIVFVCLLFLAVETVPIPDSSRYATYSGSQPLHSVFFVRTLCAYRCFDFHCVDCDDGEADEGGGKKEFDANDEKQAPW